MKSLSFAIVLTLMMAIGTGSGAAGPLRNSGVSLPAPGTMERRAILDDLRYWVRTHLGLKVRFVVRHLKVKSGWAWVVTEPQSPDGTQRYEPLSALLKKGKNCWAVVAVPSGECAAADDPERACRQSEHEFIRAVTGAPLFVPVEIFR
ncbi:hypothetical protein [Nitratifractor sp.]|uniref:hypothetical protein n=1 Tax=Nitratifractor sp. TaxID=2268144 RepID=UPI0025FA2704|nr:hypothetical protein [Nitratifractor sp.]